MPASKAIVRDLLDRPWWVQEGDPGWEAVHANLRAGRKLIVLPLETLARGVRVHPDRATEQIEKLTTTFEVTQDDTFRDALRRAIVLYDCLTEAANEKP